MEEIKTKACIVCGKEYPITHYRRPDGCYESCCKECQRKKHKERRERKKEMFKFKY